MRPLTKRGIERGKVTLLRGALTLQLSQRGVHFVDLLIQLVQRFLGFAQLARGGGDGLSCALSWATREARCCCCCCDRPLFSGDIGLNGFKLVASSA
jgi:hypothetical protein